MDFGNKRLSYAHLHVCVLCSLVFLASFYLSVYLSVYLSISQKGIYYSALQAMVQLVQHWKEWKV